MNLIPLLWSFFLSRAWSESVLAQRFGGRMADDRVGVPKWEFDPAFSVDLFRVARVEFNATRTP